METTIVYWGSIKSILGLFTIPFGTRIVRSFNAFCQLFPRVADECMMGF